jgi:hypothetical protein
MSLDQTRRGLLVASGGLLAGCAGGDTGSGGAARPTTAPPAVNGACLDRRERPATLSATHDDGDDGAPPTATATHYMGHEPATLRPEVVSGGPPKDGIPSIDSPQFRPAGDPPEQLSPGDPVLGVVRDGTAKAYPQFVLVHHEIVNDELAGTPISVTYCPLTGTALGFERGTTNFGVSGNLVNNNLVMYDRATDSRWPQILGTAIEGDFEGRSLREFRAIWTTWRRWRRRFPDTSVLSTETGYARNYRGDPYGAYNPKTGYYSNDRTIFPRLVEDDRLAPKRVVIGARDAAGAVAVAKDRLREAGIVTVGDQAHVAVYDPVLDTGFVHRVRDPAAFDHDGCVVTGPDGEYVPHDLPGERIHAFDAMWFAWSGFYPDTALEA